MPGPVTLLVGEPEPQVPYAKPPLQIDRNLSVWLTQVSTVGDIQRTTRSVHQDGVHAHEVKVLADQAKVQQGRVADTLGLSGSPPGAAKGHILCGRCNTPEGTVVGCARCQVRVCRRCLVGNTGLCGTCWELDDGSDYRRSSGHSTTSAEHPGRVCHRNEERQEGNRDPRLKRSRGIE